MNKIRVSGLAIFILGVIIAIVFWGNRATDFSSGVLCAIGLFLLVAGRLKFGAKK